MPRFYNPQPINRDVAKDSFLESNMPTRVVHDDCGSETEGT